MQDLLVKGVRGEAVRLFRQALALQLGSDAGQFPGLAKGDVFDPGTEAATRRWQAGVGLIADGIAGPYCQEVLGVLTLKKLALPLDLPSVRQLFPATKPANISRYLPYVAAALGSRGLTERLMVCAALATIRAESEGFLPISEFQSSFNTAPGGAPFALYDDPKKKLGNRPGDGARFKGRGFVQLTGRDNYEKFGALLGIDLAGNPDLANAPEVAALLLARFLESKKKPLLEALKAGRFADARRLVNGGSHGLDRFRDVFRLAAAVWPAMAVPGLAGKGGGKGGRTRDGKADVAAVASKRSLTVRKDPGDLKDRPYLPPPRGLEKAWPLDRDIATFLPLYSGADLILDQGSEGACTGFGLACVVNYLRWTQAGRPKKMASVSPRMLYNFARRYDEYAGESYDGSSCRGAIKGWFNHGVCLSHDWAYSDKKMLQPRYGYADRAAENTLGVYYRIDLKSVTDMQAAIQDVGAIYVSAYTHAGWDKPLKGVSPPLTHDHLPVIPFDGRPSETDGHAFAMVGFNAKGFVIQNSWGKGFGAGGFAVLTYADWLTNGMDAWVVALGVPGVVVGRVSERSKARSDMAGAADTSQWWSEDKAYQHSVVLGNDGRVKRYQTEDELTRTLLHQVSGMPEAWFRTLPAAAPKRLVIIAHGGLNDEAGAIKRARAMGRHFLGNGCYPVFLVWKTGLLESIADIISEKVGTQPSVAGGVMERFTEQTDLLIEKTIGANFAKPIWSEMKENARLAFDAGRGGDLMITALQKLVDAFGDQLEVHLVGHSAGSIILGHMVSALGARRMADRVKSTHLYAPACSVQFANQHYAQQPELMKRMYMHVLSNEVERNDNVAAIYRKSLLYFVSNALDVDLRTPILGLQNVMDKDYSGWDGSSSTGEALKAWRQAFTAAGLGAAGRYNVISQARVTTAVPDVEIDAAHGSFDNDVAVIGKTLELIRGGKLLQAVDDLRGF